MVNDFFSRILQERGLKYGDRILPSGFLKIRVGEHCINAGLVS